MNLVFVVVPRADLTVAAHHHSTNTSNTNIITTTPAAANVITIINATNTRLFKILERHFNIYIY